MKLTKHEKLVKSLGRFKSHIHRPERIKKEIEKLPLYKTPRKRDL